MGAGEEGSSGMSVEGNCRASSFLAISCWWVKLHRFLRAHALACCCVNCLVQCHFGSETRSKSGASTTAGVDKHCGSRLTLLYLQLWGSRCWHFSSENVPETRGFLAQNSSETGQFFARLSLYARAVGMFHPRYSRFTFLQIRFWVKTDAS